MKEKIIKIIENMEGSLLGIGLDDDKILDKIEENEKIDLCYILSNGSKSSDKKFKLFKKGKDKTVNIKKLKKYFKKKSIDNVLCDYNVIKKYIRSFQAGSVYINKGKLIIYGSIKDLNNLEKRYKRYTKDVKLDKNNKAFILTVNNKNTKSNILKDLFYKISDLINDIIDYLTFLLTN